MSSQKKPDPIINEVMTGQWMVSFSDLLTLLLAFFVLLLTMSSMDDKKFQEAFGLFSGAFGTLAKQRDTGMSADFIVPVPATIPELLVRDLGDVLDRHLRERMDEGGEKPETAPEPREYEQLFEAEAVDHGVDVRIAGDVLFEPGTARLSKRSIGLLRVIGEEVSNAKLPVRIVSYVPPRNDRDGAWRLSVDRASAVTDVIARVKGVKPELLSLMGYGRRAPRTLKIDPDGSVLTLSFFVPDGVMSDLDELFDETEEN